MPQVQRNVDATFNVQVYVICVYACVACVRHMAAETQNL